MTAPRRRTIALSFATASVAVLALGACSSSSSSEPEASATSSAAADLDGLHIQEGGEAGVAPNNWPSDVPFPQTLALQGSGGVDQAQTAAWMGDGDMDTIANDLKGEFESAGWTASNSFVSGATGSVTLWTKGSQKVQVTVAQKDGQVLVSETIVNS